jgi:hypothetical protein
MNMAEDPALERCLTLISRIAARGAASPIDEHVRDTLMELQFYLDERQELFNGETRLERLHRDLYHMDVSSEPLIAELILKYAARTAWN